MAVGDKTNNEDLGKKIKKVKNGGKLHKNGENGLKNA